MIECGHILNVKNVLSFRKKLSQNELQDEMNNILTFIKNNNLKVTGPKISTTYSVTQAMIPSFDMEILIPVDKEFKETDMYKFKKEIKLTNCLKINYKGHPKDFQNSILTLQKYIQDNKLMPISSLYTVNIKDVNTKEDIENFEADAYVSISPNIL